VKTDAKHIVGKTLGDAGLRHLTGLFVYSIERPSTHERFDAPSSQFVLQAGDVIGVAGDVMQVNRLWRVDGLEMHADDDVRKLQQTRGDRNRLVEVVVAPRSSLVGRTPRDIKFRTRFNAAIVGVHRRGEKRGGAHRRRRARRRRRAAARHRRRGFSHALSPLDAVLAGERARRRRGAQDCPVGARRVRVQLLDGAMIVLASIDEIDCRCSSLALINGYIFWLTGIVRADEARASVDISVMTMVAASIGLSSGMQNSGLACASARARRPVRAGRRARPAVWHLHRHHSAQRVRLQLGISVAHVSDRVRGCAALGRDQRAMICYVLMLAGSADFRHQSDTRPI
jgi:K+/H+ antiporter YhaU regulatory subunit KhtT